VLSYIYDNGTALVTSWTWLIWFVFVHESGSELLQRRLFFIMVVGQGVEAIEQPTLVKNLLRFR
jgi:hypothetical protein